MVIYAVILFVVGALFLAIGAAIYRGRTDLIHDYHRTRVRGADRRKYGRAFSAAMFLIAATLWISGAVALLGETKTIVSASIGILIAGLTASLAVIVAVQKKYNGGIF